MQDTETGGIKNTESSNADTSNIEKERRIRFKFHPYNYTDNQHFIEKEENGIKRKYLRGVSSGIKRDGHGERMTEKCITSMMNQGKSGNVLLYAGLHGVNFNGDLGILVDSEVINGTDWMTTYRLFDELDDMPAETIGKVNKLWKKIIGAKPYKSPVQKGFSIEGIVPESEIIDKVVNEDGSYSQRVINDIVLDGVVVVSRPAYEDSVVSAVYKCLGELPPQAKVKIKKNLGSLISSKLSEEEDKRNFYHKYFEINSIMEDQVSNIMRIQDGRNSERLTALFDEYKDIMLGLILQHADIFQGEPATDSEGVQKTLITGERANHLMKALAHVTQQLSNKLKTRIGGTNGK